MNDTTTSEESHHSAFHPASPLQSTPAPPLESDYDSLTVEHLQFRTVCAVHRQPYQSVWVGVLVDWERFQALAAIDVYATA